MIAQGEAKRNPGYGAIRIPSPFRGGTNFFAVTTEDKEDTQEIKFLSAFHLSVWRGQTLG